MPAWGETRAALRLRLVGVVAPPEARGPDRKAAGMQVLGLYHGILPCARSGALLWLTNCLSACLSASLLARSISTYWGTLHDCDTESAGRSD